MRSLVAAIILASFGLPANAGNVSSEYTDLDPLNDCVTYAHAEEGEGEWANLACSGYRGYPVLLAYDDARESIFYGFPSADMTPVWESFASFNSSGAKVEWRIETTGDVTVPFAAIHRRFVSKLEQSDKSSEVLLIAKVGQPDTREGCSVGLVMATGNANANEDARKIADDTARTFVCGKDKRVVIGTVPAFGRVDN